MTETRTCDQCGKHLVTHRADARFCDERCRARWNNKHRVSQGTTDIRIEDRQSGVGSRGGNVRSVDEARILQSESKERDRWRLVMEVQIHRTLVETGYFHVDDLDSLDAPPFAVEARGTLVNAVRQRGHMQSTDVRRKVAHAAANARKAPIYRITEKGRRELPKLLVGFGGGDRDEAVVSSSTSGSSPKSGEVGTGVGKPQGPQGLPFSPVGASTDSPASTSEALSLLPEPDPKAWAA